jgi:tetratricopeptide (TPR) repeat protein
MASHDLFISYSRENNRQGQVTQFVEVLKRDFRQVAGRELRPFFDTRSIEGMDDWRDRILTGLRDSYLFIAFLSPTYLQSRYCKWEVVEYLKHEIGQGVVSEGIAPIYFLAVDGWHGADFDHQCEEWIRELRARQNFDLQPWYEKGEAALMESAIAQRMEDLRQKLKERVAHGDVARDARGNIPRFNLRFSGRVREMHALRRAVAKNRVGLLTAVHGLGGIGKTALACAYAHSFAAHYPGGRWQLRCEGKSNLFEVIGSLDAERDFDVTFTEEEKIDPRRRFERVLKELRARADAVTPARVLLILDNVDQPALLAPGQVQHLPSADWIHVIATTRLGEEHLGDSADRYCLTLNELPEDEAMDLLEKWMPEGKFPNEEERAAVRGIVQLLGGFTLAIEAAAVHLAQHRRRLTCARFLAQLQESGLAGLEAAVGDAASRIQHDEIRLSVTLRPTLEGLRPAESLILGLAALLPPDQIPLPWLRAIAAESHPELAHIAKHGDDEPWLTLLARLLSLRLLQQGGHPEMVRMHRLVQELVLARETPETNDARTDRLFYHAQKFAIKLWDAWLDPATRWELDPLIALARLWLGSARREYEGGTLAAYCFDPARQLARYAEAEWLCQRALEVRQSWHGPGHSFVADSLSDLGLMLQELGRHEEAIAPCQRALEMRRTLNGPAHRLTASAESNLGLALARTPRRAEAEALFRSAGKILRDIAGPDDVQQAYSLNNLGDLLVDLDRPAEALPVYCRALSLRRRHLAPGHPLTAHSTHALAEWLRHHGSRMLAEKLHRRALNFREKCFGPEHPLVAESLHNLAGLVQSAGRLDEAENLYARALKIREKTLGTGHLFVAYTLEGLASVLEATGRGAEATPLRARARRPRN